MEDMNVRANEIEELDPVNEVEETSESSGASPLIAGVIGGFLAYAAISGAKKLKGIVEEKWKARKFAEARAKTVKDEAIDLEPVEMESNEEESDK